MPDYLSAVVLSLHDLRVPTAIEVFLFVWLRVPVLSWLII